MPGVLGALLGGGPQYVLNAQAIAAHDGAVSPADATAIVQITLGVVDCISSGVDFDMVTLGDSTDLEIFVTTVSGTVTSGTTDAWVPLNSFWTLERTGGVGTTTYTGTYAVRVAATGQVLVSGVAFSLAAEVLI